MLACLAVILGPGLVLLLAAGLRLRHDRWRLDRAGIGVDRPGCPACLYPLGGWSSPACPECGVDVRQCGVLVRPTTSGGLVGWGVGLLVAAVALPLAIAGAEWVLGATGSGWDVWWRASAIVFTGLSIGLGLATAAATLAVRCLPVAGRRVAEGEWAALASAEGPED